MQRKHQKGRGIPKFHQKMRFFFTLILHLKIFKFVKGKELSLSNMKYFLKMQS